MIRHIILLLVLIMSVLLGFFCVDKHKDSILSRLMPQPIIDEMKVVDVEMNQIEPTSQDSVQIIQSVERAEPVVTIRVDETEPKKPIIKKMSSDELFGKKKSIKSETIDKPTAINDNNPQILTEQVEETNIETPTPTPTPTNDTPKIVSESIKTDNKSKNNIDSDMSEIERRMLEEMKNFK